MPSKKPTPARMTPLMRRIRLARVAEAVESAASATRIAAAVLAATATELKAAADPDTACSRARRECGKTAEVLAELGRYFRSESDRERPLLAVPKGLT